MAITGAVIVREQRGSFCPRDFVLENYEQDMAMELIDIHLPEPVEFVMAWWFEQVTAITGVACGKMAGAFEKTAELLRIIETMNGIVP